MPYLKPSVAFRLLEQLGCSVDEGSINVHSEQTPALFDALRALGFPVVDGHVLKISRGSVASSFSDQQAVADRLSQGRLHGLLEKSEISDPLLPLRPQVRPISATIRRPPSPVAKAASTPAQTASKAAAPQAAAPQAPKPPRPAVDVAALVERLTGPPRQPDESEISNLLKELTVPRARRSPGNQVEHCSGLARPRRRVQSEISVVALQAARWGGVGCRRSGFVPKKFIDRKSQEISDHSPLILTRTTAQQVEISKKLSVARSTTHPVPQLKADHHRQPRSEARGRSYGRVPRVQASDQQASVERLSCGLNPFMRQRLSELRAQTTALFPDQPMSVIPTTPMLLPTYDHNHSEDPEHPEHLNKSEKAGQREKMEPEKSEETRSILEEIVWLTITGGRIYTELDPWVAETSEILLDDCRTTEGVAVKESSLGRLGEVSRKFFAQVLISEEAVERLKMLREAVLMKIAQLDKRSRAREILNNAVLVDEDEDVGEGMGGQAASDRNKGRKKMSYWS